MDSLQVEPRHELRFVGPFTEVVTVPLKLRNPTDRTLLFKVKTTVPKAYCVRPNCGPILPGDTEEVGVMLQPFNYNADDPPRHKFLIQTVLDPGGSSTEFETKWRLAPSENVNEVKLRCVFTLDPTQPSPSQPHLSERDSDERIVTVSQLRSSQEEVSRLREALGAARQDGLKFRQQSSRHVAITPDGVTSRPPLPEEARSAERSHSNSLALSTPLLWIVLALVFFLGVILGRLI